MNPRTFGITWVRYDSDGKVAKVVRFPEEQQYRMRTEAVFVALFHPPKGWKSHWNQEVTGERHDLAVLILRPLPGTPDDGGGRCAVVTHSHHTADEAVELFKQAALEHQGKKRRAELMRMAASRKRPA